MEELITTIYEITVEMNQILKEENYEEFEKRLNTRDAMMKKVDVFIAQHPEFQYTPTAKQLLEDTFLLDQQLNTLLQESISKTEISLNQVKMNKQVSKKYHMSMSQTNGVFLDKKK